MNRFTSLSLGLAVLALAGCGGGGGGGGGGGIPVTTMPYDTPINGTVVASGNAYFAVTLPSAGSYNIFLSGLTNDADPSTYTDSSFTTFIGGCTAHFGTTADICAVTTTVANTVIYIMVSDWSRLGESFTLSVVPVAILAHNTPTTGAVSASGNNYYQVTLPMAGNYVISLSGLTNNADPIAYADRLLTTLTGTCTANTGTIADTCSVTTTAANTVINIMVSDRSGVGASYALTSFVAATSLIYNTDTPGSVLANGTNYYQVTLPTAGNYIIAMTQLRDLPGAFNLYRDANPTIYSDNTFTTPIGTCSANTGSAMDFCAVTTLAANTVIYIKVAEIAGVGATYVLTAAPLNTMTYNTPTAGSVTAGGLAYYQVTLPTAGKYLITRSGGTSPMAYAYPKTFTNNVFTTPTGTCTVHGGRWTDGCTVTTVAANTVIYLQIDNTIGGSVGTTFTLNSRPAPVNQGTIGAGGPVVLAEGVPYAGQVAAGGVSYYQVTLAAAGKYLVTIDGRSDTAYHSTFTDNMFGTRTGPCSIYQVTISDSCMVTTAATNTVIYIRVIDSSGMGETFTLTTVPGPVNQGATGAGGPIVLTPGTPIAGQVAANGFSYYQVTYPAAGTYTINLWGMMYNADPTTFTDNLFATATGTCTANAGVTNDTCTVTTTAANTVIYIKVADMAGTGETLFLTP